MENQEKQVSVSSQLLFALMGIVSLGLLVLSKILMNFGVVEPALYGVFSIFIYILPFVGIILSYLGNKKVSVELIVNLAAFVIAMVA